MILNNEKVSCVIMQYKLENDTFKLKFEIATGALKSVFHKKSHFEAIGEPRLASNFKLLVPLPELRHNYLVGSQQKLVRFESAKNLHALCLGTISRIRTVHSR